MGEWSVGPGRRGITVLVIGKCRTDLTAADETRLIEKLHDVRCRVEGRLEPDALIDRVLAERRRRQRRLGDRLVREARDG